MIDAYYMTNEADYNEILKRGSIVPTKGWYGKRLFPEDFLAGDHRYAFMSVNHRYVTLDEEGKDRSFGLILNAELLVTDGNALVGHDLLNEYRTLLNECAAHIVLQNSTLKNVQLIVRGVLVGAVNEPGVTEAMLLFKERVSEFQSEHRCGGQAALKRLRESSESLELLISVSSSLTAT